MRQGRRTRRRNAADALAPLRALGARHAAGGCRRAIRRPPLPAAGGAAAAACRHPHPAAPPPPPPRPRRPRPPRSPPRGTPSPVRCPAGRRVTALSMRRGAQNMPGLAGALHCSICHPWASSQRVSQGAALRASLQRCLEHAHVALLSSMTVCRGLLGAWQGPQAPTWQ